jgi:hypothetical protein
LFAVKPVAVLHSWADALKVSVVPAAMMAVFAAEMTKTVSAVVIEVMVASAGTLVPLTTMPTTRASVASADSVMVVVVAPLAAIAMATLLVAAVKSARQPACAVHAEQASVAPAT